MFQKKFIYFIKPGEYKYLNNIAMSLIRYAERFPNDKKHNK